MKFRVWCDWEVQCVCVCVYECGLRVLCVCEMILLSDTPAFITMGMLACV